MSALLTVNLVAIAAFAWVSAFKIVPYCTASLFRYRLWRLRDRLVDEIRSGAFDDDEQPRVLVSLVEAVIESASELSALNLLLFRLSAHGVEPPDFPLKLDEASPKDRALLEERFDELDQAAMTRALAGTPSGWVALIVGIPFAAVIVLIGRLSRADRDGRSLIQDTKLHVFEEFELDPALALIAGRNDRPRRALYHHV